MSPPDSGILVELFDLRDCAATQHLRRGGAPSLPQTSAPNLSAPVTAGALMAGVGMPA